MTAQGNAPQADQDCITICQGRLGEIKRNGVVLLDTEGAIALEYVSALGRSGRPGVGRSFVKWVWDSRFNAARCRSVGIRRRDHDARRRYEEFPDKAELRSFDSDDQKFVAVALAAGGAPPILNAVDSDWWIHADALAGVGVRVEFLCPRPRHRRQRSRR